MLSSRSRAARALLFCKMWAGVLTPSRFGSCGCCIMGGGLPLQVINYEICFKQTEYDSIVQLFHSSALLHNEVCLTGRTSYTFGTQAHESEHFQSPGAARLKAILTTNFNSAQKYSAQTVWRNLSIYKSSTLDTCRGWKRIPTP